MKRGWFGVALATFMGGCGVQGGIVVELQNVIVPNDNCEIEVDGFSASSGFYDPTGEDNGRFQLSLRVQNHMAESEQPDSEGVGAVNLHPNSVSVRGFNACWYREDDLGINIGAFGSKESPPVECESLPPTQQRFLVASGNLPVGDEAIAVISVDFPRQHLRGLYGDAFDPAAIPRGDDPTAEDLRSDTWGAFPARQRDRVVLQVQLLGEKQAGGQVESNWFLHPIELCIGCIRDQCDGVREVDCQGECGTAGVDDCEVDAGSKIGTCSSGAGTTNPGALCYDRGRVGEQLVGDCLPFQGLSGLLGCGQVNECALNPGDAT